MRIVAVVGKEVKDQNKPVRSKFDACAQTYAFYTWIILKRGERYYILRNNFETLNNRMVSAKTKDSAIMRALMET